jgi:hypothetical protein
MDVQNSVVLLTHQAALVVDYGFIVGLIAVIVACASMYYKMRTIDDLRRTGEHHDRLHMNRYDPTQKYIVTRPEELDEKKAKQKAPAHRWRSRR